MKKLLLSLFVLFFFSFSNSFSQTVAFDSLDINNINARINANGNLFWDLVSNAKFEVPKNSGKNSIFNSTFWVGGLDSLDTLHMAASLYNQSGHDFFYGPVSNVYNASSVAAYNKTWKIYKSEIDDFKSHWGQSGYVIPQSIINWPAHGDVANGQSYYLAPFYDRNGDGAYDPNNGDYPLIKGDEAIFFVLNDDMGTHTESHGNKLGIEVRVIAYAFDCSGDSALWNTIFVNFQICNFSHHTYHNTYVGVFTDFDLGFPLDDYVGSDVQRGSYYVYNGDSIDGAGQPYAYGHNPPAQSVTFLAGPYMDADGTDNPSGQCDNSISGANFGNGTIDDERLSLDKFIYFNNSGSGAPSYSTDPINALDYYKYLNGYWKDSTKMIYGGNAHPGAGGYGPECNFMFPADSDPCNWGTMGSTPFGPTYWTEQTAGNQPGDRRGLGASGPFTFRPGAIQYLDVAYVFGRNYLDSNASAGVQVMQQRIDSIRNYFKNDYTPCGGGFSGITTPTKKEPQLNIYPNPANNLLTVELNGAEGSIEYKIYDIIGKQLGGGTLINSNKNSIKVSNLKEGLYILQIANNKNRYCRKFIKE